MGNYYKPRAIAQIDAYKFYSDVFTAEADNSNESSPDQVVLKPSIVSLKLTKNSWKEADEATVTLNWYEGGADPRMLKNARVAIWLWDDMKEPWSLQKHLRFTGVCTKVERHIQEHGWSVDLSFQDYTSLFIHAKPFPTEGIPEWTDTIEEAWMRLCDHTGWKDDATGKIKSNVAVLRNRLVCDPPELRHVILGKAMPSRFRAISKPTPPHNCDAWAAWDYCMTALGYMTFIEGDNCHVTTSMEYYTEQDAPKLVYGHNILDIKETSDPSVSGKGIRLTSFDPLTGRTLESVYPPPDDERIKKSRADATRVIKAGSDTDAAINAASGDYIVQHAGETLDQATLDLRARAAWEEWSRQELHGEIKTGEMEVDGEDVCAMRVGENIRIEVDNEARDMAKAQLSVEDQVQYLMDTLGYSRSLSELIVKNIHDPMIERTTFHIGGIEYDLTAERFEITIKYHNKVDLKRLGLG